ncbi:TIR domain-containing protein [Microbulbifer sp. SA54]|uniref:TIR domain-containing protein n=1 Tax=Microbulbifer sp. SA54 TaxID=3401577 RepID=UPI003AAE5052
MSDTHSPQRYRAFISYSHQVERCAIWLQRALESFRFPKNLIGRKTSAGVLPARFGKVFRDRTDLSVAADLGQELHSTLDQSDYLLVVCSPASARSKWVNEEILYFKRKYGESRILAVIVAGEPFASASGSPEQECLPQALRFRLDESGNLSETAAEPLASDLRPQGDGKRLALLKLITAMSGLALDELVQRDHQRRLRIQKLITAAAMVAVTVLSGLTYTTMAARDLAEQRRLAAEDLINFMLTDLRDKLEPVGRLDVLDVVGKKVLDFYDARSDQHLEQDALGRKAAAMHLLGEIRNLAGDTDGAVVLFGNAANATAELLAQDPNNPQRIFDHAQSVFWVGFPDYQRGSFQEALRWFEQYLALAKRLAASEPENPDWQREVFYALNTLAVMKIEMASLDESLALFVQAQNILSRLPQDEESREAAINNEAWIATAYNRKGDQTKAIEFRLSQLEMIDAWLTEEPQRANLTDYVITAQNALVNHYHALGNHEQRDHFIQLGHKTAAKLLQLDPANTDFKIRAYEFYLIAAIYSNQPELSPAPDAMLSEIRALASALPDHLHAQKLRWRAELLLPLKYSANQSRTQLLESANAFAQWRAGEGSHFHEDSFVQLSVLTRLLTASDPQLSVVARSELLSQGREMLQQIKLSSGTLMNCGAAILDKQLEGLDENPDALPDVIQACIGFSKAVKQEVQTNARR